MKNPAFPYRLALFGWIALLVLAITVRAEPPDTPSKKTVILRAQPQVIYHLPSSNYAATLHSQAKVQSNDLPIDGSMPTSLQLSRANANAAAVQARQESPSPSPQDRGVTHPRVESNQSPVRHRPSPKAIGRKNSHGNKAPKK